MPSESYLVGLIGEGITVSLTPPMHEREADLQGMRYLYRPVDLTTINRRAESVGDLLEAGRDLGFNAFNITHPCKQLVMVHLDEVSDDAERLDAVNTVLIHDGRFIGHNTDFSGFAEGMTQGLPQCSLASVVQVGTGGAGSAVAYALLKKGTQRLILVDLDTQRATRRAAALQELFPHQEVAAVGPDALPSALSAADGLVNATPVGMHTHPGIPVDPSLLESRHWVADVIYRPVITDLVKAAKEKGCQVLDGGHMAVGQAVDAFRLITGIEPDAERMRAHFLELVAAGH